MVAGTDFGDSEVIAALGVGGDDYIVKPFNADVLLARINANLRKAAITEAGEPQLVNEPMRMDLVRHGVFLNDKKVALTPKEYLRKYGGLPMWMTPNIYAYI